MRYYIIIFLLSIVFLNCNDQSKPTGPKPPEPLTVTSVSPLPNTQNVSVKSLIVVRFSENINPTSAIGKFQLKTQTGDLVSGQIQVKVNTLTFIPDSLSYKTTYNARVLKGIKSENGGELKNDYVWSFSTQGFPPDYFLSVKSVFPRPSASNVPRDTKIYAVFSESINPATVNNASFYLTKDGINVPANLSVSQDTVYLSPVSLLDYSSAYQVAITPAVKSISGKSLQSSYSWSFTTENPPPAWTSGPYDRLVRVIPAPDGGVVFAAIFDSLTVPGIYRPGFTDVVVGKFNSDGTLSWRKRYKVISQEDVIGGLTIDDDNSFYLNFANLYISGTKERIVKFNYDGSVVWNKLYKEYQYQGGIIYFDQGELFEDWFPDNDPHFRKINPRDGIQIALLDIPVGNFLSAPADNYIFAGGNTFGTIGWMYVAKINKSNLAIINEFYEKQDSLDFFVTGVIANKGNFFIIAQGEEKDTYKTFLDLRKYDFNLNLVFEIKDKSAQLDVGPAFRLGYKIDETGIYFVKLIDYWNLTVVKYDFDGNKVWETSIDDPGFYVKYGTQYYSNGFAVIGNTLIWANGTQKLWFFDKMTGQRINTD